MVETQAQLKKFCFLGDNPLGSGTFNAQEILSTPLATPTAIANGRYKFCELIATGSKGLIYKAHDLELDRYVAIKCMFEGGRPGARGLALDEAKKLASMSHPNIVRIFDVVIDGDKVFLITEWIEGMPASNLNLPLAAPLALAVMAQVYEALAAAHAARVIHRDIRPGNILIGNDGRVTLMDFGSACGPGDSSAKKSALTFRYIDPRVLEGAPADEQSDLYSAALLQMEMMTAESPIPELPPLALARYIMRNLDSGLESLSNSGYPLLTQLIRKCIHASRYSHSGQPAPTARDAAIQVTGLLQAMTGRTPECYLADVLSKDRTMVAPQSAITDSEPKDWAGAESTTATDESALSDKKFPSDRLMIGESDQLRAVYKLLHRLAPVNVPALILGETGTGKELAAKELHRLSGRSQAPLLIVNATALPETLIESELFGHKRGAFTGALGDRIGLIEQADGGTLFIDEIGELSATTQIKLLRVLQEKTFSRVGDATLRTSDFRLVAATNKNLQEMIAAGQFREDLYYRIAGAVIAMPSLRERRSDILLLATFFRTRFANNHGMTDKQWSSSVAETLENLPWPGNVRELANVVARAFVMADGPVIHATDLGDCAATETHASSVETELEHAPTLEEARDAWMKHFLTKALDRHNGRRTNTAKALGIGERTLFRYIEQLEIS